MITPIQKKIVKLYMDGLRSKEISEKIGISKSLIDNQVAFAKKTTGCKNLVQLAIWVYKQEDK
jgi:DNA-binding NarL/FixJ family response regulator